MKGEDSANAPVWGADKISYDCVWYLGDGDMTTVRRTITTDVAKFRTKGEAREYIFNMEKAAKQ